MKKLNKKGFTIVELVIVIAVIAILAAVMIPTFGGIIDKANASKALQEAKNAYTNDLVYLDGNPENYGEDDYPEYKEKDSDETKPVPGKTYYTKSDGAYSEATLTNDVFADKTKYYVRMVEGTFDKTNHTYSLKVGDYTATYDWATGKWDTNP